jgi:hypothetical protein
VTDTTRRFVDDTAVAIEAVISTPLLFGAVEFVTDTLNFSTTPEVEEGAKAILERISAVYNSTFEPPTGFVGVLVRIRSLNTYENTCRITPTIY